MQAKPAQIQYVTFLSGNVNITTLDFIHHAVKTHVVLESGFCFRLQVEPTQMGPVHRAPYWLALSIGPTSLGFA
jgi:hypothetical protein